MSRLTIVLTGEEMERLQQHARREYRHPREQARYILRRVLLGESPPNQAKENTSVLVSQAENAGVTVTP